MASVLLLFPSCFHASLWGTELLLQCLSQMCWLSVLAGHTIVKKLEMCWLSVLVGYTTVKQSELIKALSNSQS